MLALQLFLLGAVAFDRGLVAEELRSMLALQLFQLSAVALDLGLVVVNHLFVLTVKHLRFIVQ